MSLNDVLALSVIALIGAGVKYVWFPPAPPPAPAPVPVDLQCKFPRCTKRALTSGPNEGFCGPRHGGW